MSYKSVYTQEKNISYFVSGGGSFSWTRSNNTDYFGVVNVLRYSFNSRLVKMSALDKNSITSRTGSGLLFQIRNLDQFSDSINIYDRFISISPFFRIEPTKNLYIDLGITFEKYKREADSNPSSIIFQEYPEIYNRYPFLGFGYLIYLNKKFLVSPVVTFPIKANSNIFHFSSNQINIFIEFIYKIHT